MVKHLLFFFQYQTLPSVFILSAKSPFCCFCFFTSNTNIEEKKNIVFKTMFYVISVCFKNVFFKNVELQYLYFVAIFVFNFFSLNFH